jgi:hypothetical protein
MSLWALEMEEIEKEESLRVNLQLGPVESYREF